MLLMLKFALPDVYRRFRPGNGIIDTTCLRSYPSLYVEESRSFFRFSSGVDFADAILTENQTIVR